MINKHKKTLNSTKIAIIGGGVAGSTAALGLGRLGFDVTLFEKNTSLVDGPPFCHLHAGGNLYREISDSQCITLLRQSIAFLKLYPYIVDYRPTVIALPTTDPSTPQALFPRLELLKKEYQKLISQSPDNQVLGRSENYYALYSRERLEALRHLESPKLPQTEDEWMIPVAQHLDFEKVQFPLILVQEYGLNLFRLAAGVTLALEELSNVTLKRETEVIDIKKYNDIFSLSFAKKNQKTQESSFDYLINAAGFRTGKIDDMLAIPCKRMVEFKAAYVTHWKEEEKRLFPEMIFHGERGTPQGMGQFTPYPNGYFQLHGMTHNITLYNDGLVSNTPLSCQPKLKAHFMQKVERSWSPKEVESRTENAIAHLSKFIPAFQTATVSPKPLFGAQQIPGDDPTLRVAEVSFPLKRYARCEIVKVSSAIDMTKAILKDLIDLGYDVGNTKKAFFFEKGSLKESELQKLSHTLCKERNYPLSLGERNIPECIRSDDSHT